MDSSLLTLPPHLVERIGEILASDVDLPLRLRRELQSAVDDARGKPSAVAQLPGEKESGSRSDTDTTGVSEGDDEKSDAEVAHAARPTIDIDLIERLARWCSTPEGEKRIRKAKLEPRDYSLISLMVGTEVYLPPSKVALLASSQNPDKPNPYLPSHLSPRPPPLAGYKALNKQISTILNVLFSIFGTGGAVYVAATTGAGYTREMGILFGVLGGCVVGIAEVILLWIFVWRAKEARKVEVEQWKGSSSKGIKETLKLEIGDDADEENTLADAVKSQKSTGSGSREIRFRRRAIPAKGAQ